MILPYIISVVLQYIDVKCVTFIIILIMDLANIRVKSLINPLIFLLLKNPETINHSRMSGNIMQTVGSSKYRYI